MAHRSSRTPKSRARSLRSSCTQPTNELYRWGDGCAEDRRGVRPVGGPGVRPRGRLRDVAGVEQSAGPTGARGRSDGDAIHRITVDAGSPSSARDEYRGEWFPGRRRAGRICTVRNMDTTTVTTATRPEFVRMAGWLCLAGAIIGVIGGLVTAFIEPAVGPDRYSYPYTPTGYVLAELTFILNHVLLLVGVLGLARSGAAGTGRLARVGLWASAIALVALTLCEVASIARRRLDPHRCRPDPRRRRRGQNPPLDRLGPLHRAHQRRRRLRHRDPRRLRHIPRRSAGPRHLDAHVRRARPGTHPLTPPGDNPVTRRDERGESRGLAARAWLGWTAAPDLYDRSWAPWSPSGSLGVLTNNRNARRIQMSLSMVAAVGAWGSGRSLRADDLPPRTAPAAHTRGRRWRDQHLGQRDLALARSW